MSQPPPYDPYNPATWNQNPDPNQNPNQNQNQQNPNQQNQQTPPPNFQQNPFQQAQNPYQQNPYQQTPPPWQLQGQMPPFSAPRELPNSVAILVLGIISIIAAFCYGVGGIGFGLASLLMGNKAMRDYEANPGAYASNSYNNAKAGRICGIIGLVLGSLVLLVTVLVLVFASSYTRHHYSNF